MTTVRASAALPAQAIIEARPRSIAGSLVAPATMIVLLCLAVLLLMTPMWMHFALNASGGTSAAATPDLALRLSDRTVAELLFGPGAFTDYAADEASHMRDARIVLYGFLALAAASIALLAWEVVRHSKVPGTWSSIARGGIVLAVILMVLGVFAAVAFDAAFALFHRIFFPGGNFEFPLNSLLIRLYPFAFWQFTAAALGVLGIGAGLLVWLLAGRRARALAP